MADPLSVGASSLAVVSAAVVTAKSLYNTVDRFKQRDRTLKRLLGTTKDLLDTLQSLEAALDDDVQISDVLRSPVEECNRICREFEQAMLKFSEKPKLSIIDWGKMEFKSGYINEFMDSLATYKSTISVGLGIITLYAAKAVPEQVLEKFTELVQDTTYSLELQLQRIHEQMTQITTGQRPAAPNRSVDLEDEKAVTEQCLRVCEDAQSYLTSLANQEATLLEETTSSSDQSSEFEARLRTRQTLQANYENFAETINHLQRKLQKLLQNDDDSEAELRQLDAKIRTAKKSLELCKMATDVSREKEYRLGEVTANGDSDQVVVNTYSDLFVIKKASVKDRGAQLLASTDVEGLRLLIHNRYSSGFGRASQGHSDVELGAQNSKPIVHYESSARPGNTGAGASKTHAGASGGPSRKESPRSTDQEQQRASSSQQQKPSPNEMRKRQMGEP